jgi:putative FmdB family regulatory protein
MPIYEYRCATCGYQNEYLQRVSDPLLTECPECRKPTFNKLVSAAGFQLKGTGWYATDFKTKTPAKPQADKAADKPADKPAETKKDDAKSEAASGTGACPAST